jgi:hypothetical protein
MRNLRMVQLLAENGAAVNRRDADDAERPPMDDTASHFAASGPVHHRLTAAERHC